MKKQLLALVFAGALGVALTACTGSTTTATTAAPAAPAAPAAETTAAAPAAETTAAAPAASSGEVIELIMGNVTSSSAKDAVEQVLIPKVSEYSNGTIKISHFPDNQLGNDDQSFQMTQTGECDIAVGSTSSVAVTYNDLYIYDVPYLFLSKNEVYEVGFNGETGKSILEGFDAYNLKGLAFWENGFRNLTTNNKDIATVDDLKGLKIRVMANDIHLAAWKAMGANPTPMAFGELFTALQQGTVDGQENPYGIIVGNNFHDVEKFCTQTEHSYTPYYVVMNKAKWESLTAEQQDALTRAMEEATKAQYEFSQKYEDEAVAAMESKGCQVRVIDEATKAIFKEKADSADCVGLAKEIMYKPELADAMVKELEDYRNK